MAQIRPKFKVGDILQVKWSKKHFGLIQIESIERLADEGEPGFYNLYYCFKHLTGDMAGRKSDMRGLSVVEELLKAKPATKMAVVLYGENSSKISKRRSNRDS